MDFDLVVVGGGHNGLVCAAYAAEAGLRVCVVERHDEVGGAAITETFHPGFKNSAASYTVSLLQPKIIAGLDLARHGLEIVERPLANFVPARDGPGLELANDFDDRLAAIAEHSTRDAERYRRYSDELDLITALVRPAILEAPVEPFADGSEFVRALRVAARTLGFGPRAITAALRLLRQSAG
ncbi:MAG: FAD-dependent oxidoreductase, partial [Gammaproteobacteria bacterium]|nr:FAD-dependent oxidoreductase [Gammaproteobacteria bacterium]